jgi:tRNA A58 N-methylase Trm61
MATAPFRIYIVTDSVNDSRLVKAQNPQQAISHVAGSTFTVRKATPEDAFAAAQKGKQIETYKDSGQQELEV